MSISNNLLCNPLTQPGFFFKLSCPLIMNILSFLSEQEIATTACCQCIFPILQDKHLKIINERRAGILGKLISSQAKVFLSQEPSYTIKLLNGCLSFTTALSSRFRKFLDLNTLSICSEKMGLCSLPLEGGPIDEKISVLIKFDLSRDVHKLLIIDNIRRCIISLINLPKPADRMDAIVAVFGTDQRPCNQLEFVTSSGKIFFYKPEYAKGEDDIRETNETIKSFCCIPKEYLKEGSTEEIEYGVYLEKAFKVKNSYYFQWQNYLQKTITFLTNISSSDHVTLNQGSNYCCADNHFFYNACDREIVVFKGKAVWKKIFIGHELSNIKINPCDYGLVVSYFSNEITSDGSRTGKFAFLTIWNHKKYEPYYDAYNRPFFHKKVESSDLITFVSKNVLFYKFNKDWSMYYIPTRKELGTMDIPHVNEIVISDEYLPKHLVVKSEDKMDFNCNKFYVFSDEC